jgi:hypothetical protein
MFVNDEIKTLNHVITTFKVYSEEFAKYSIKIKPIYTTNKCLQIITNFYKKAATLFQMSVTFMSNKSD